MACLVRCRLSRVFVFSTMMMDSENTSYFNLTLVDVLFCFSSLLRQWYNNVPFFSLQTKMNQHISNVEYL